MKADLHVHSTHSDDGHQTIEEIMERCRQLDIRVLAITDHNDMGGCGEAERLGEGMIIIPGIEISSKGGHILGLGLTRPVPRGLEVSETIRQIHQAGGIAIAPHPYRMSTGLGEQNIRSNDFDAIEVANGRSRRGWEQGCQDARGGDESPRGGRERCARPQISGTCAHRGTGRLPDQGGCHRCHQGREVHCHGCRPILDPIIELGGHEHFAMVPPRPKKNVTALDNSILTNRPTPQKSERLDH